MGNPLGIHMKPAERKKQAITDLERKREHMLLDQRVIGHVTSHQSSPDYRISARRVNFRWQRGTKIGNTQFLCPLRSIAAHRDHFVRRLSVHLSVRVCVRLSGSHTFLVVTHSYVLQATRAFLGMLPLCLWIRIETCVFVFLLTVNFKLGRTFDPQRDRYFVFIYITSLIKSFQFRPQ